MNAKSGTAAGSGLIEAALLVNHALACHRRTVEELMRDVQVDEQSRVVRLVSRLDPTRTVEVALVYYESPGYDFDGIIPKGPYGKEMQSSDEAAWTVRRTLEESLAVTSPSIPLQLLGQPELQLLWRGDEGLRSALRFDEHSPEDLSKCLAVLQDSSPGPPVPTRMPCAAIAVEVSSKEGRVVSKVVEDTECTVGIFSCLVMNRTEVAFDRTAGHVLRTFGHGLSEQPLIDTALLTPGDITENGSDSVVE
ncbi:hypothetical protein FOZ63_001732 [Perkinsus olseni]|uniref:Glutathione synthase substrate-binding domain-containing protein n=1 Tax=Perkinsus olseni TaxID=32597 RepID=A0A7J6SXL8_PEROL|nr:hypothetical protein FOZ63_001732 [Perkinsus olseni]